MGKSLYKKILWCESQGLLVYKLILSPVCLLQLSVLHTLSHLLWPSGCHVTPEAQLNRFSFNSITNSKSWHGFSGQTNNTTANQFSDLFSSQKIIVIGVQAQSLSNFLYYNSIVFIIIIIIIINCQVAFKLDIRYYRQSSNLSFLNSLSLALSERYVHPQQCLIVHLRRKLIIIGWAFMHQLNISTSSQPCQIFLNLAANL